MRREIESLVRRLHGDQSGSVAIMVALQLSLLFGFGSLAVDAAYLLYVQRTLQATTDAAAVAAASEITGTNTPANVKATAMSYSAVTGNKNAQPNLTVTMVAGYPLLKCLTSTGISCGGSEGANAVEVQQQATVPLFLAQALGFKSVTVSAVTALATAKGGFLPPLNVMIIIDTTGSMNSIDPNCSIKNATRIACALAGVQVLLKQFWPTVDQVGLMVFPGLTPPNIANSNTNYVPYEYCVPKKNIPGYNSNNPPSGGIDPYSPSAVYQIIGLTANFVPFSSQSANYKTSNTASSLDPSSDLVLAAGGSAGCAGVQAVGGVGTYYADVLTQAQARLVANGKASVQNVIIFVSDGAAGSGDVRAPINIITAKNGTILNFASGTVPTQATAGAAVTDLTTNNVIPSGATVVSTTSTTVTISKPLTGATKINDDIQFGPYNQCNLGIAAAQAASNAGTWVYTIAYGADTASGSCSDTEKTAVTACSAMQKMASDPTKFYSDGVKGGCTSAANPTKNLVSLFQMVGNSLTAARLLSLNTQ